MKTTLILPDGRMVRSGVAGQTAVQSFMLTQCVNPTTELEAGGVCASMVQLRLWLEDSLQLQAGQQITVLQDDVQLGVFRLEKPSHPTANTLELTAYDRIVLLDRDLSAWLAGYNRWPCPLQDLAGDVCRECGLELVEGDLPNGEYPVPKFAAEGVTGRQILQWIAQIAGRFLRATPEGKAEFAWYVPAAVSVAPDSRQSRYVTAQKGDVKLVLPDVQAGSDGRGNVTLDSRLLQAQPEADGLILTAENDLPAVFYYQNGLTYGDYQTEKISHVLLRQSQEDVGVGYPETGGENPYILTANPLLTGEKAALQAVAQTLYTQLQDVTYTPCRLSLEATEQIRPGQCLPVQDAGGKFFTAYIMSKQRTGGRDVLECTGSYRRGTATEVNSQSYRSLQGKVLNLRKDVDGLWISNEDAQKNLAQLQLSVSGLQATVQQHSEDQRQLTTLEQTAQSLQLRIQQIENVGVSQVVTQTGYTLDHNGLHIQKSGQEMENTLDHTGMYVRRGSKVLLQANHKGVEATDVTVHNYLIVGEHARFEDYGGGTGCFWI